MELHDELNRWGVHEHRSKLLLSWYFYFLKRVDHMPDQVASIEDEFLNRLTKQELTFPTRLVA